MCSSGEDVGIDDVVILTSSEVIVDTTPPVITTPTNISGSPRTELGFYVEFTATATDDTDGTVAVHCSHDSGHFPLGVTTVTCTATDSAGNTASASFTITSVDTTPTDTDGDGFHDGID